MHDEGLSYAVQAQGFSKPQAAYEYRCFALSMDRAELYRRIDERVDHMLEQGLVDEVRHLMRQGATEALTSRQAIGYKELIQAFMGELTYSEAIDLIKQRSRRYAKRQLAWCRRDPRIHWLDINELGIEGAIRVISEDIRGCNGTI